MNKPFKIFSAFTGIGGFELAATLAGEVTSTPIEIIGAAENNKYAASIFAKHFPGVKNYGDITKLNPATLENFNLLTGGFPCQAFSVAGHRRGFEDTRGTMFFELARILAAKQPSYFIFENVKGILSHDKGNTFRVVLETLDELGYHAQWQNINSANHGVPQNRERIYIIGHLAGIPWPEILPLTGTERSHPQEITRNEPQSRRTYLPTGTSTTLSAEAGGGGARTGLYLQPRIKIASNVNPSERGMNGQAIDATRLSPTLTTNKGEGHKIAKPVLTPTRAVKRQNGRRMKNHGEPSFTLTTQDQHGIYDGAEIRRLTPLECERLQAFPDSWTSHGHDGKPISDTQRYRVIGNAVTVTIPQKLITKLINHHKNLL